MQAIRVLLLAAFWCGCLCAASVSMKVPVSAALMSGRRIVLHVEGLKLPPACSGIVRVFAGFPEATEQTSTDDRHYLGYFTILPQNSREAQSGIERKSVTFDLTDKKRMLTGSGEVTLTLVALGDSGSAEQRKPVFTRAYLAKE